MQECLDKFENVETSYKVALINKGKKVMTEFHIPNNGVKK